MQEGENAGEGVRAGDNSDRRSWEKDARERDGNARPSRVESELDQSQTANPSPGEMRSSRPGRHSGPDDICPAQTNEPDLSAACVDLQRALCGVAVPANDGHSIIPSDSISAMMTSPAATGRRGLLLPRRAAPFERQQPRLQQPLGTGSSRRKRLPCECQTESKSISSTKQSRSNRIWRLSYHRAHLPPRALGHRPPRRRSRSSRPSGSRRRSRPHPRC